jgi:DNA polymerase I-like protein with 3'-5' exonuclease and polymerase domains/uracil-DNA glycosylase
MGFFDSVDTTLTNQCSSCTGRANCKHPCLDNYKGTNGILLLFGSPSKFEDDTGIPFQDNIMDWYKEKFDAIGIDFDACSKAHVTGCYVKDNKSLTKYLKKCENRVIDFIKEIKPKLILAFGSTTLNITVAKDYTRDISNSTRWRGFLMPYRAYGFPTWLLTTFDFSEVCLQDCFSNIIKNKEAKEHKLITTPKEIEEAVSFHSSYKIAHRLFLTDIRKAVIGYKKPIPEDPAKTIPVHVLKDKEEIIDYLQKTYTYLKNNPNKTITLDLETNGLKTYDKNKRIYSCAIYADPALGAFSFPLNPVYATTKYNKNDEIPKADTDITFGLIHIAELNPRIVGANFKFDLCFLAVCLGIKFEHVVWDTVVVAHLLDPRDGVTSLKFATYTLFGVAYEEGIHDYLKSSDEDREIRGTNALNDIFNAPIDDVLYYNALDVVYTYSVMKEQYKQWLEFPNPNKWFAFKLFHKVIPVLAHMEMNGILIDMEKVEAGRKQCEDELKKIEERIKDDPVWIKWGEIVGVEKRSILSASQIIDVFINHMHLHPHGISMKEKAKADLEWLSKLVDQEPFIQNILDYRKYTKILHTYLDGIAKEVNDDGRLRCFYTTNNVSSYRIAANSPNFMNMSSRDSFQVDLVKTCFLPDSPDYHYTSFDFSGLENCGTAYITGDKYFTSVLTQGVDMHRENACYAFCMTDDEFEALKKYDEEHGTHYAKTTRNGGKAASFSVLYGAGKETVANTLWKYCEEKDVHVTPTEKAKDRIIKTLKLEEKYKLAKTNQDKEEFFLEQYIEHADAFLKDFWNNRMVGVSMWKQKNMDSYFKNGFCNYPIGCTVHGLFSSTFLNNCIIQGSSSSITLWCLIMLDYLYKYFNINGSVKNIIHDDINCAIHKNDIIKAMSIQKAVMEECTRFAFPWITFNLKAECEISPLGKSWAEKKEYTDFIEYYERNKNKIIEAIRKAVNNDWTFKNWR